GLSEPGSTCEHNRVLRRALRPQEIVEKRELCIAPHQGRRARRRSSHVVLPPRQLSCWRQTITHWDFLASVKPRLRNSVRFSKIPGFRDSVVVLSPYRRRRGDATRAREDSCRRQRSGGSARPSSSSPVADRD